MGGLAGGNGAGSGSACGGRTLAGLALLLCALALISCARPGPAALMVRGGLEAETQSVAFHVASIQSTARPGSSDDVVALSPVETRYRQYAIAVPAHHQEGQIELSASPGKGFAVTRPPAEFSRTGFIRSIEDHLQRRTGVEFAGHVFIFVHGYNTRYEEAVLRMAQLLNDSETRETSVLFAWPSFGKYVRYSADRERSLQSRDELEHLLDGIAGSTAVERVHIVAHSMGSMLAMETLRQIAFKRKSKVLHKLGTITLVAPDVDVEVFKSQLSAIGSLSSHVFAVVAKDDLAIGLSNRLVGGMPRLGNLDVENRKDANSQRIVAALCQKDVKIISLRNISGCDSTGHSGYACVIRKLRKEVPAAQACADNVVSGLE